MIAQSSLLPELQQFAHTTTQCLYAHTAYPLRIHLQAPFGGNRTLQQEVFNTDNLLLFLLP